MLRQLGERARPGPLLEPGAGQDRWRTWVAALGLGTALACAYFLAARLGLALVSEAEGVPVFWPASGVAAGALIVLQGRARALIAAGVLVATVVVDLLGGRTVFVAAALGLCNAGEAMLTAWLVDRWCGRAFKFEDWRGLWGFIAAAAVAAMVSALGAALAIHRLHAAASLQDIWRVWAAADGLGIVIVAPLVVGLYHLAAEPMPKAEAFEGTTALAVLAVSSSVIFAAPPASPLFQVPPAEEDPIHRRLKTIDVDNLTPLQALSILADLKREAGG